MTDGPRVRTGATARQRLVDFIAEHPCCLDDTPEALADDILNQHVNEMMRTGLRLYNAAGDLVGYALPNHPAWPPPDVRDHPPTTGDQP